MLQFSNKKNEVTPYGCVGAICILLYYNSYQRCIHWGIREFYELEYWLNLYAGCAPLVVLVFYVNRDK
jgi:hypothetical protein